MRKARLYLETSVFCMIDALLAPEKSDSKDFYRIIAESSDE